MTKLVKDMTPEELERKRAAGRRYYEANRKKLAEMNRKYYEANKEKEAERKRKYRKDNKEKVAERKRKWYEANKEKEAERKRKYYEANKEKEAERARKYRKDNKEKEAERKRKYRKDNRDAIRERIKSDPNKLIAATLRRQASDAFRGNAKTGSFVRDLGMSIDEFRVHIENQFDEFMTWENRGVYWQFDHIYPLDKANLRDRVEFLAVANWRNYQPLEAGENIRKGNKVTPKARRLFESLKKEFST